MIKLTKSRSGLQDNTLHARLRWVILLAMLLVLVPTMPVSAQANVAPTIQSFTASPNIPIALDALVPVVLTATFSDPDSPAHYVIVNWDDGTTCEAHDVAIDTSVDEYCSIDNEANTITASHRYAETGVYSPFITVGTEGQTVGGKAGKQYRYVVIFDDSKGHIKGAGGFQPSYPYNQFTSSEGVAQFGFAVGYNPNGTFRSNSQVRFALFNASFAPVFTFTSTSFNWMMISRPFAIVEGLGTIDGVSHRFVLSIIDGALQNPVGPDRLRIRITRLNGSLYYDNEFAPTPTRDIYVNDPTMALGGGLLVIADAPGAAANASKWMSVGVVPGQVLAKIGLDNSLFLPAVID